MRTFQQQRNYEQLEQLPPQVRKLIGLGVRDLWQSFLEFWEFPSKEPRVRQKINSSGNVYWQVYDPWHDCTLHFDHEQEVMVWLEEQHYRRYCPNVWTTG